MASLDFNGLLQTSPIYRGGMLQGRISLYGGVQQYTACTVNGHSTHAPLPLQSQSLVLVSV
jgi:hypothetical protein